MNHICIPSVFKFRGPHCSISYCLCYNNYYQPQILLFTEQNSSHTVCHFSSSHIHIHMHYNMTFFQWYVRMESCNWWTVWHLTKVVWRSAPTRPGAPSVMTTGVWLMLESSADNLTTSVLLYKVNNHSLTHPDIKNLFTLYEWFPAVNAYCKMHTCTRKVLVIRIVTGNLFLLSNVHIAAVSLSHKYTYVHDTYILYLHIKFS